MRWRPHDGAIPGTPKMSVQCFFCAEVDPEQKICGFDVVLNGRGLYGPGRVRTKLGVRTV